MDARLAVATARADSAAATAPFWNDGRMHPPSVPIENESTDGADGSDTESSVAEVQSASERAVEAEAGGDGPTTAIANAESPAADDRDVAGEPAPAGPDLPESEGARTLLVTAAATAVFIATAAVSANALLVAVPLAQALLIIGWVIGSAMPGRIGGMLVTGLACAGADVAVMVWPTSGFSPVLAPLGLGVLALFVHQLARGVVRARVVESVAGCATVLVAGVALTGWLQLRHEFDGRTLAVAALAAAGGGCAVGQLADLAWSRPRLDPHVSRGLLGLIVATVTGGIAGTVLLRDAEQIRTVHAVLISAGLALITAMVSAGAAFLSYSVAAMDQPAAELAADPREAETVDPETVDPETVEAATVDPMAPEPTDPTDVDTDTPEPDTPEPDTPEPDTPEPDTPEPELDVDSDYFGVDLRPWPALRPLAVGLIPLALVAPAAYVLLIGVG